MEERKDKQDVSESVDRATELKDGDLEQTAGGMLRPPRATVLPPDPKI
jgi:hypothetical protein